MAIDHEPVPPPTSSSRWWGAEVEHLGQRGCRPGEDRLDPGGRHLLKLAIELEDLPRRPAGQGLGPAGSRSGS
jgi:hypothetical protein